MLIAACYLHDVGYARVLRDSRFHPLDGARSLRSVGRERLASLVAYHSSARAEAEERGLLDALRTIPEEHSVVADAPTYCDLTHRRRDADTVSSWLAEIVARHGEPDPVAPHRVTLSASAGRAYPASPARCRRAADQ